MSWDTEAQADFAGVWQRHASAEAGPRFVLDPDDTKTVGRLRQMRQSLPIFGGHESRRV